MSTLYEQWSLSVKNLSGGRLFFAVQFINSDESVSFGSPIQNRICEEIGIPQEHVESFWTSRGSVAVHESIRVKRGSVVAAMKIAFLERLKTIATTENTNLVPPPQPSEFLPNALCELISNPDDDETIEAIVSGDLEEYVNSIVEKKLRDSNDQQARLHYSQVLLLCARPVLGVKLFNKLVNKNEPLEKYITPTLEAFIVAAYVSNYKFWMNKFYTNNVHLVNEVSTQLSNGSQRNIPIFTERSRGSGKYQGWSELGLFFYNCLTLINREQRKHAKMTTEFGKLFIQCYVETTNNKGTHRKRKSIEALNDLDHMNTLLRE